jgi:serine/threonine-protein kinase
MPESQPDPPSGLVAGKYEVLRLIGRGGMGAVWEGRHSSLGTRVAIKFIDAEYADSREARSRFDTEARAAAALESKHAIHIFDHGVTDDGRPYMVMELLVGEPLDTRIERLGSISLQETARILAQVCRALQRAHDAGIIHRDLKPENIFLVRSPDDDDEIAKVLDFGIAKIKVLPGAQGTSSSTKTGAVLGTPYYMSPEQARGLRTIDSRADLWSLGVIAYKCVVGVLPFEGESVGDLLVKICTAPPPVPSQAIPGLPTSFDAWFARTMEREPARRFATASELADALLLAAGMSVRRAVQAPSLEVQAVSLRQASDAGSMPVPLLPTAGMTSAPFVTSTSPPKASRGRLFAVVGAALLGGGIGVAGVVKLLAPGARATPAAMVTPMGASGAMGAGLGGSAGAGASAGAASAGGSPSAGSGASVGAGAGAGPSAGAGGGAGPGASAGAGSDAGAGVGIRPAAGAGEPGATTAPVSGVGAMKGAGGGWNAGTGHFKPAAKAASTPGPAAKPVPTKVPPSSDPGY